MLLVAQRVVSPGKVQGINAYRYRHVGMLWPDDPRPVLDAATATLERKSIQLRPGGNRVMSYLDIAAPDRTPLDDLAHSAMTFAHRQRPSEFPFVFVVNCFAFRIGLEASLVAVWRVELEELLQRLLLL
jgi:hypothetical protein